MVADPHARPTPCHPAPPCPLPLASSAANTLWRYCLPLQMEWTRKLVGAPVVRSTFPSRRHATQGDRFSHMLQGVCVVECRCGGWRVHFDCMIVCALYVSSSGMPHAAQGGPQTRERAIHETPPHAGVIGACWAASPHTLPAGTEAPPPPPLAPTRAGPPMKKGLKMAYVPAAPPSMYAQEPWAGEVDMTLPKPDRSTFITRGKVGGWERVGAATGAAGDPRRGAPPRSPLLQLRACPSSMALPCLACAGACVVLASVVLLALRWRQWPGALLLGAQGSTASSRAQDFQHVVPVAKSDLAKGGPRHMHNYTAAIHDPIYSQD